jgi:hypothetical protein
MSDGRRVRGERVVQKCTLVVAIALAGCASTPQPKVAPASPLAPLAAVDGTTRAVTAEFPGYRKVEKNGATMYCRNETSSGSRLNQQTVCMTEQQLRQQGTDNQRTMEKMNKKQRPLSD